MKVIQNNDTVEVTCTHCKSVLAVSASDITYFEMAHHGSPFQATCCVCKTTLHLRSGVIPRRWYDILGVE